MTFDFRVGFSRKRCLWDDSQCLQSDLGCLLGDLRRRWNDFGRLCRDLGRLWNDLGRLWAVFGTTWSAFGVPLGDLGHLWVDLGRLWNDFGMTWGAFEVTWGDLGRLWGDLFSPWGVFGGGRKNDDFVIGLGANTNRENRAKGRPKGANGASSNARRQEVPGRGSLGRPRAWGHRSIGTKDREHDLTRRWAKGPANL